MSINQEHYQLMVAEETQTVYEFGARNVYILRSRPIEDKSAIISFSEQEHARVKRSLRSAFKTQARAVGLLQRLPPDLRLGIFEELDLQTIFRLRQVNRETRRAVTYLTKYRAVRRLGLDCLRLYLITKAASTITLNQLCATITQRACQFCSEDVAELMLINDSTRCCLDCIKADPDMERIEGSKLQQAQGSPAMHWTQMYTNMYNNSGVYMCWDDHQFVGPITSNELARRVIWNHAPSFEQNAALNARQSVAVRYRNLAILKLFQNLTPEDPRRAYCFLKRV
ncbi:hypothetical protein PT974_01378 [Cladobotryum mycophilum]|uniref:F-box domain-containing protein n=1 Tax=Cladobotryum mycophilum TaxID=491253 RepID=A0ABR0T3G7_9HYPO